MLISPERKRAAMKQLFEMVFLSGMNLTQAIAAARTMQWPPHALRFLEFLEAPSKKGVCQLRPGKDDE